MGKRIFLFIVTNIAVVLTLTIVLRILGVDRYFGPSGLNIGALAAFSLVWGMTGSVISLLISRWMAKMATGMVIVNGRTGDARADRVYSMIAGLAQKAGLPMPEVGIYDSPEVNAFATGPSRSRALVAVSTGLLRSMNDDEVEGVLGHEVTHIANGDMVTMTLLQGIINAFVIFFSRLIAYVIANRGDSRERGSSGGSFLVVIALQIVLGLLGSLITAWYSRQREFRADKGGATLAGRERMVGALRRLAANEGAVDTQNQALATLKINGARSWMVFFHTHPPLEARIAALERM